MKQDTTTTKATATITSTDSDRIITLTMRGDGDNYNIDMDFDPPITEDGDIASECRLQNALFNGFIRGLQGGR